MTIMRRNEDGKAPGIAQEPSNTDTVEGLRMRLKIAQTQAESVRRERDKALQNYERERAWCRYLEQNTERLKEFIRVNGHTAGCASRKTECCPNCGDSTYDHHCELPFDCNCGFHDMLQPLPREADHVR